MEENGEIGEKRGEIQKKTRGTLVTMATNKFSIRNGWLTLSQILAVCQRYAFDLRVKSGDWEKSLENNYDTKIREENEFKVVFEKVVSSPNTFLLSLRSKVFSCSNFTDEGKIE